MNPFFGDQYSQEDLQRRIAQRRASGRNALPPRSSTMPTTGEQSQVGGEAMDTSGMMVGDSLDDIIMQNSSELRRQQSLPQTYHGEQERTSMMEFGTSGQSLHGYHFTTLPPSSTGPGDLMRMQPTGEWDMAGGYANMGPAMNMPGQIGYSTSMHTPNLLTTHTSGAYTAIPPAMVHGMMVYGMGMQGITEEDETSMNMLARHNYTQPFASGNMEGLSNEFMISGHDRIPSHPRSLQNGENDNNMVPCVPRLALPEGNIAQSPRATSTSQSMMEYTSSASPSIPPPLSSQSSFNIPEAEASTVTPGGFLIPKPEPPDKYKDIYSSSNFDMLGVLLKVTTRKNPEINIGKVDLSCAFVICDYDGADCPIVYVSEIFERLTGYSKHEILGRNCRFLQSPDGKVQAGSTRQGFVDNNVVYYLKSRLDQRKESQRSLINYRKGGQPFLNLLTMIPVPCDDQDKMRYVVGFQIDLVVKPEGLEHKNANGNYTINYSQGQLPRYIWHPPEVSRPPDGGQTITRDDVSTLLSHFRSNSDGDMTKRMWDKLLVENSDDVVHVLSLKGLFLYLSPSCRNILEYDSSELIGTALSSICHPSDIVPVTREMKDTSNGSAVDMVFRVRRKNSGYTWFESHGSLSVEQGKGRKCIILVGRERPVYALARTDIKAAGGTGENELWSKVSTSGMFLFVSSNVRALLDRQPEEMIGTSIQALMRSESKVIFGRSLEKARTGQRVTYKHEVQNNRGLVLQAQTTLYPGDASEGQKPTFLVAQTRLLKASSRGGSSSSKGNTPLSSTRKESVDPSSPLTPSSSTSLTHPHSFSLPSPGPLTVSGSNSLPLGSQDALLASADNLFDELKTTRCTSWQFELRQMEKSNRLLAEELASLLSNKKKRKRRKGKGDLQRDCANCHTSVTPEWRRGPSGQRDLCNSCGLRWAKVVSRGQAGVGLGGLSGSVGSGSAGNEGNRQGGRGGGASTSGSSTLRS